MLSFDVNWLAVGVALIVNMVVGALWYGPLFGKAWMKENGFEMEDLQGGNFSPYAVAILNSFLMAFILANVIAWTGTTTLLGGALLGFLMWLGFTGFTFAANHAFEMKTVRLWLINSVVYLVGLELMGIILALWQ